jgi:hypothetical protein
MARKASHIPRYLLAQCFLGCIAGLIVVAMLLATDTGGIGTLVAASSEPIGAIVVLVAGSLMTTIPLVVATAIGLLASRGGRSGARRPLDQRRPTPAVQTVPAQLRRGR